MPDNNGVIVTVDGNADQSGKISGSGQIDIAIDDASQGSVKVDYQDPDHIDLVISGKHSFKVDNGEFDVSGSIKDNLVNGSLTVEGESRFAISKEIAATISTQYNTKEGASASAKVSISF